MPNLHRFNERLEKVGGDLYDVYNDIKGASRQDLKGLGNLGRDSYDLYKEGKGIEATRLVSQRGSPLSSNNRSSSNQRSVTSQAERESQDEPSQAESQAASQVPSQAAPSQAAPSRMASRSIIQNPLTQRVSESGTAILDSITRVETLETDALGSLVSRELDLADDENVVSDAAFAEVEDVDPGKMTGVGAAKVNSPAQAMEALVQNRAVGKMAQYAEGASLKPTHNEVSAEDANRAKFVEAAYTNFAGKETGHLAAQEILDEEFGKGAYEVDINVAKNAPNQRGILIRNTKTGERTLAVRGTVDKADVKADLHIVGGTDRFSLETQHLKEVNALWNLASQSGNIQETVSHSLGGHLSTYLANKYASKANPIRNTTFNGALSLPQALGTSHISKNSNAYHVSVSTTDDVVSALNPLAATKGQVDEIVRVGTNIPDQANIATALGVEAHGIKQFSKGYRTTLDTNKSYRDTLLDVKNGTVPITALTGKQIATGAVMKAAPIGRLTGGVGAGFLGGYLGAEAGAAFGSETENIGADLGSSAFVGALAGRGARVRVGVGAIAGALGGDALGNYITQAGQEGGLNYEASADLGNLANLALGEVGAAAVEVGIGGAASALGGATFAEGAILAGAAAFSGWTLGISLLIGAAMTGYLAYENHQQQVAMDSERDKTIKKIKVIESYLQQHREDELQAGDMQMLERYHPSFLAKYRELRHDFAQKSLKQFMAGLATKEQLRAIAKDTRSGDEAQDLINQSSLDDKSKLTLQRMIQRGANQTAVTREERLDFLRTNSPRVHQEVLGHEDFLKSFKGDADKEAVGYVPLPFDQLVSSTLERAKFIRDNPPAQPPPVVKEAKAVPLPSAPAEQEITIGSDVAGSVTNY